MDRPIECTSCTKQCAIIYKQLKSSACTEEAMCQDCPVLKKRLMGLQNTSAVEHTSKMSCKECHTSLDDVLRQDALGCACCYEVFYQAICQRLTTEHLVFKQEFMPTNDSLPSSEQLLKLSKDLQEAVVSENFEKAAILRDEINNLKKLMSS